MSELIEQVRGVSYKPTDLHDSLDDDSVVLLRANNIDAGKINFDDVVYVDRAKVAPNQYLRRGDILVCASSGSRNLVGKAASVDFDKECTFGAFCKVVRPTNIDADYLGMYFQSNGYRSRIAELAQGININNIRNEHIDNLSVAVYDDKQQKRIVEILQKTMFLINVRRQQLQKLDDLIKARFVEMFGDPEHNDKAWPIQTLDKLCTVGSSKRIYQNEQSINGIPFWRIADLINKIDTGFANSGLFISKDRYTELKQSGLVPIAGDILVTSRGTLGRCYIVDESDQFYFQDGMISWLSNLTNDITPLFLQYLFMMPGFRKQIYSMQAGSTVAYLSIAMLKKLQIIMPSKEVQNDFALFLQQLGKSKNAIKQSVINTQMLFDSLSQEYFI